MADQFGMSFSPAQPGPGQAQNGQRPSPVQQAIQTLSLRIPKNAGASAFTPQTLLDSPGGAGLGGDANSAAILEAIKRMLFGGQMGGSRVGTGPQLPRDAGGGGTFPFLPPWGGPSSPLPGMPMDPNAPTDKQPMMPPHFAPVEGTGAPTPPPAAPVPFDAGPKNEQVGPPGPPGLNPAGGTIARPDGAFDTWRR